MSGRTALIRASATSLTRGTADFAKAFRRHFATRAVYILIRKVRESNPYKFTFDTAEAAAEAALAELPLSRAGAATPSTRPSEVRSNEDVYVHVKK